MLPSSVIDAMESMLANDGVSTSTTPQYVSQGVSADLDSELKVYTTSRVNTEFWFSQAKINFIVLNELINQH